MVAQPGENTHNECSELFPIRRREIHHGIEDLDAGIGVDIDTALIWCAGSGRVRGRYIRRSTLTYASARVA